jgi:hypothetical protein
MTPAPTTNAEPSTRIARADRVAALAFAARSVVGAAVIALAVIGVEQLVLAYPTQLAPEIPGLPVDRLVQLRSGGGRVVLIGDSVVQTVASGEDDQRNLGTMLEAELGGGVLLQAQAASGAELHRAWLHYLRGGRVDPHAVVIGVNPRAFSPHWDRNPGWLFHQEAAIMTHPVFARCASVLEWEWGRPTGDEFAATPVFVQEEQVGTLAALERTDLGYEPADDVARARYLVRYGSDYARSRHLEDLEGLVDEANAQPFPVILYLTPIDVDAIRERLDPSRLAAVEHNLELLRATIRRSRWPTVDASSIVRTPDFDHPPGDPHEHLKAAGRLALVRALVPAIRNATVDAGVGP